MGSRKTRVVFLHRAGHNRNGSKLMRCDQLCAIASAHLADRFDFEVHALPHNREARRIARTVQGFEDAIVILLKRADTAFDDRHVELLKETARAVVIDYVDAGLDARSAAIGDLHIAASVSGHAGMTAIIDRLGLTDRVATALLLHHADPRIAWRDRKNDRALSIGYFGLLGHATLPANLKTRVALPDYDLTDGLTQMLSMMETTNVHYCLRPARRVRNSWKPFTKGINAAAAGANVLVSRDVEDAVEMLGPDYPFLIPEPSDAAIVDAVHRVEGALGTPVWGDALDRMEALRARTAPPRLMQDFSEILSRFS